MKTYKFIVIQFNGRQWLCESFRKDKNQKILMIFLTFRILTVVEIIDFRALHSGKIHLIPIENDGSRILEC